MGILKINGIDVNNYIGELYTSNRTKQNILGTKLKGFNSTIDSGSQYAATGWLYDVFEGKLKHNGNACTCAAQGTRPINATVLAKSGAGMTYYLKNENGTLYLKTSISASTGEIIKASTDKDKRVIINIALWGAGGKGGGGAYWFLAGNWGGIGGGGGAKVFYTLVFENNTYCQITTGSESSYKGRTTDSSDTTYSSPFIRLTSSTGITIATCNGGKSGIGNHPRWATDNFTEQSSASTYSTNPATLGNVTFYLRKKVNGAAKQRNGMSGKSSTFGDVLSPAYGNPEGLANNFENSANGGQGPHSSYTQPAGSGGGAGYHAGGKAGDTGSGSAGSGGTWGGGGGGGGSPANGAAGGNGGHAGFRIFY